MVNSMANAPTKREEGKTSYAQGPYAPVQGGASDEDILNSFQNLCVDESRLSEQREHLAALLKQMEAKAKEEIEKRKRKVEKLNSEVLDLKRRCEKFSSLINSELNLECSQTGP